MRLQRHDPEYSQGPVMTSALELSEWLDARAGDGPAAPRWFRLAVHVCFDDEFRLAVGEAALIAGDERVPIQLDGTRMSLSLLGELTFRIPQPEPCGTVWMEGQWLPGTGDRPMLVVRRVGQLVDGEEDLRPAVADLPGG